MLLDKSNWKLFLAIAGIVIVGLSTLYTNYLAKKLAAQERRSVKFWVQAQRDVFLTPIQQDSACNCDYGLQLEILNSKMNIPAIIVNERDIIIDAMNFGEERDSNTVYLQQQLVQMKTRDIEPIELKSEYFTQYVYYKRSRLLTLISYFPIIQILLISAFVLAGYMALRAARRVEENKIWVGMAKETAHQLGTPISAILAWIEHLKMMHENDENTQEVANELTKDAARLELIADRFSKIGSAPELEEVNMYTEIDKCMRYMKRRAPRRVQFEIPEEENGVIIANINPHLFEWVVENLLRNALDAMEEGKGKISAEIYQDDDNVYIDIEDTGKGIPANKFSTVFKPGYSTKKRGWGLGLSLAKRIIESYHSGKIFVKNSEPGQGTTFTIALPR